MSGANEEVNEILSAVLSFLIVGVGHVVINGQTKRGAIWFVGTLACGFILGILAIFTLGLSLLLIPIFPIGSAIDAYLQAQKINSGEVVP